MVNNLATSPSFIANSTACRHLAMTPLLVQSQTRNPPTCFQFHRGRFHGIDRLVVRKLPSDRPPDLDRATFLAVTRPTTATVRINPKLADVLVEGRPLSAH